MSSLSQKITSLREDKNLKKKDLAKILNVSAPCISQYESGKSEPSYDTLILLSQYFDVSIDYLLGNEPNANTITLDKEFFAGVTYRDILVMCSEIPDKKKKPFLTLLDALKDS